MLAPSQILKVCDISPPLNPRKSSVNSVLFTKVSLQTDCRGTVSKLVQDEKRKIAMRTADVKNRLIYRRSSLL